MENISQIDPTIISTAITAVGSIITGYIAVRAGKKSSSSLSSRELREIQLIELFEPMDKYLSFRIGLTPSELLKKIVFLVEQQYRNVPPSVFNEVNDLQRNADLSDKDFNKLRRIVSSFYNWLRKNLGYPYDSQKIDSDYTPPSDGRSFPPRLLIPLICIVISSLLGAIATTLISFQLSEPGQILDEDDIWSGFIFFIVSVVCETYFTIRDTLPATHKQNFKKVNE